MPFDNTPTESEFVIKLRKARELITDPKKHATAALFKDSRGVVLDTEEYANGEVRYVPEGVYSMCLEGALIVAGMTRAQRQNFGNRFAMIYHRGHVDYNDNNEHEVVLTAFDKMIERIASEDRTPG